MSLSADWTERGREIGLTMNDRHALVVVGSDPVATSEVALGLARVQAKRRRVAIGDLFGETPPLQALVISDDPHGLVDSFIFGVSLNRIATRVEGAGELFIMPTGLAPIDYDELFVHPRWRRLAAGFREVGALLVLVAPVDAAHLGDLVDATEGAVIVGDAVPPGLSVKQSIAWLRPAKGGRPTRSAPVARLVLGEGSKPLRERRRLMAGVAGVMLTMLIAGAAYWFASAPFASERRARVGVASGSPEAAAVTGGALLPDRAQLALADSLRRDSVTRGIGATPLVDSFPLLTPANPADSGTASAWAVRLEQTNTKSGAILDLRGRFETVPAGTYGFDLRTRFFLLVAGAYPARAGAESLLVQLRGRRILAPGLGSVTSLPFAFLVQTDVPVADVPSRLARFAARGQPVYALRQPSGAAHLYFGAYESPRQAALAVPSVREAGVTPTLVYRIGRVF